MRGHNSNSLFATRQRLFFFIYFLVSTFIILRQNSTNSHSADEITNLQAQLKSLQQSLPKTPVQIATSPIENTAEVLIGIPSLPISPTTKKIILPEEVRRVWLDVGAHKEAMMTRPSLLEHDDLAVIAIEPMYDMWSQLKLINRHDRLFPIPAAVSSRQGLAVFRRAGTDMCSSLAEVDPSVNIKNWPGGCASTAFAFQVPTLRLETIIDMLPIQTVDFLKIDAQGSDFDVVVSAGRHLHRINTFVVEVQLKPLYNGSKSEQDFIDYFEQEGFEVVDKLLQNANEENIMFHNKRYPFPKNIPLEKIFKPEHRLKYGKPTGQE